MAKKSANQLYAEKHLTLTTEWFEGYNNDVFVIKGRGFHFSSRSPEEAWTEAAAYARQKLASIKERRDEVKVIKMLRAFLPSCNACLSPKDKKSVARAIIRLENGLSEFQTSNGIK